MTTTIDFSLRLVTDAELATGLGGEIVNDFLPRDDQRRPMIPASHIKGLMRAALRGIAEWRKTDWQPSLPGDSNTDWPLPMLEAVFGCEGQNTPDDQSTVYVSDAAMDVDSRPTTPGFADVDFDLEGDEELIDPRVRSKVVTRTAIGKAGVAEAQTLRTTEAALEGSVFNGRIKHPYERDAVEELALRLALLSINAVGGSRSRGGQCVVELTAEPDVTPGELLRQLDQAIKLKRRHKPTVNAAKGLGDISDLHRTTAVIELLFVANAPVCCPERPDKTNVIVSGFTIPASAVQGIVMSHVHARNRDLADKLFDADNFRCWPLNPCLHPADTSFKKQQDRIGNRHELLFDVVPRSIRVSLSHRVAKYSASGVFSPDYFFDEAFHAPPYDWPENPDDAPLKAGDGVLLYGGRLDAPAGPRLWRAQDMPRHLSTHGVQDGPESRLDPDLSGRTLYSVDAMAPLVWRGFFSVPENLAESLVESLNQSPEVSIGKRKSVRGSGRLFASLVANPDSLFQPAGAGERTVLVLQSPVLIGPRAKGQEHGDEILKQIADDWRKLHKLPELAVGRDGWGAVGIRFGWSRHGEQLPGGRPFLEAQPVLLPGSVFVLEGTVAPEELRKAILAGLFPNPASVDPGRTRGFGALAVHPGVAVDLYRGQRTTRVIPRSPLFGAMRIIEQMQQLVLPTASQIRGLQREIKVGSDNFDSAKDYLDRQCQRDARIRARWEPIVSLVGQLLQQYPESAKDALDVLADVAAGREARTRNERR